uniref:Unclassified n=1 Tax=Fusarium clavum TaxID=2594811 RepID=W1I9Z6_9HYPO|nr:unclassified [Fusarium clavum]CEF82685.1 unclassified [Fusarium clavum]
MNGEWQFMNRHTTSRNKQLIVIKRTQYEKEDAFK